MGNGLVPCKSGLASASAASVDEECVLYDNGDDKPLNQLGEKPLKQLPLSRPAQETLPALDKAADVSTDVSAGKGDTPAPFEAPASSEVPAASDAVVVSTPAPSSAEQPPLTFPTTVAQATPKKRAAPVDEVYKAPCEKTPEELDLEMKEIKKKFGKPAASAEGETDLPNGMKAAKDQAAKDTAAKKRKAVSSAASTSSKASSRGKPKRKLEEWEKIPKYDPMDGRETKKFMFVSFYREQYQRLKKEGETLNSTVGSQYDPQLKTGLTISGGHQPFSKPPDNVDLPKDFRMKIGTLNKKELAKFSCESQRMLVSVHGDLFDVSDRPDKYGEDGPYWEMTGKDITWGLTCGDDSAPNYDKYYDIFKLHPDQVEPKLQGLCSWWAFYEKEYGEPVGKLDVYLEDWRLPAPPPIEESCSIM